MNTYVVSYDLINQKNYEGLIEEIKSSYGTWAKPLESFWLVKTSSSASQIRDELKKVLDKDDKLIVIEVGSFCATYNVSNEVTAWIHDNI